MLLERSLSKCFFDLLSRCIFRNFQQFIELCLIDFCSLLWILLSLFILPIIIVLFSSVKHPTTLNYISWIDCTSIYSYKAMQTRRKTGKLQVKKRIEESTEDKTILYPKIEEKQEEWNEQMLQPDYIPPETQGREGEKERIFQFLKDAVLDRINCKLDISGVPGVGKTASTLQILQKVKNQLGRKLQYHYINALTLKKPHQIYRMIYIALKPANSVAPDRGRRDYKGELDQIIPRIKKNQVIVVDQVDFLMTKDQQVFYNMFQWSYQNNTRLTYIIIANTLDFPEKLTQKVSSRMGHHRVAFSPYTSDQIREVIAARLKNCKIFTKDAISYASKKLSHFSSDIRTILTILREAIQQHKQQNQSKQIGIQRIAKLWSEKYAKKPVQNDLAPVYIRILQYIENQGGQCLQIRLSQVLRQHSISSQNMVGMLLDLTEMGIIRVKEVKGKLIATKMISLINYN